MNLYEERKRLEQEDGEPLHTLRVMPDTEVAIACNGAGVLLVVPGLTADHEARIVKPLAEIGFFVVAIELTHDDAERGIDDIASALLYLKELASGRLGVIGLDAAAGIAIEAGTRLPQIDCVVAAGGPGPRKGTKLSRARGSMLIHRGTRTSAMSDDTSRALSERIRPAMQTLTVRDYDASDTFFFAPAFDEHDLAAEAFDRTNSFLAQSLI